MSFEQNSLHKVLGDDIGVPDTYFFLILVTKAGHRWAKEKNKRISPSTQGRWIKEPPLLRQCILTARLTTASEYTFVFQRSCLSKV